MSPSGDQPYILPATELVRLYRQRRLSPVEATEAVLRRIEDHDGAVNAFVLVDGERAMDAARASQARWARGQPLGPVDGVPTTVKDLVLAKGWPTLRGSRTVNPDQAWDDDAPATARLREAGAVLIGKTTTPEFGWKGVTDSPLTGVTRNPWNTATTPGGSSGGAAVAAALGMGALNVGTDGGGSIRIPCGFTGVFGFKPTFGRVPTWPPSAFGTLSHLGPITRTVADAALMLGVLARPDFRDWHALPDDGQDHGAGLEEGVRGLRIGFSRDLGDAPVDPEVARAVEAAVKVLADLGALIEEAAPRFQEPLETFHRHWNAGAARMLGTSTPEQRAMMDPGLLEVAEGGAAMGLSQYMEAVEWRTAMGLAAGRFHEDFELLVTPTLPIPAFAAGDEVADAATQSRWTHWTPFSYPFNLTQQPACSVPCGFTASGLPVGLQIVGAKYADALVLRAARAFEAVHPFAMPEAPRPPA